MDKVVGTPGVNQNCKWLAINVPNKAKCAGVGGPGKCVQTDFRGTLNVHKVIIEKRFIGKVLLANNSGRTRRRVRTIIRIVLGIRGQSRFGSVLTIVPRHYRFVQRRNEPQVRPRMSSNQRSYYDVPSIRTTSMLCHQSKN